MATLLIGDKMKDILDKNIEIKSRQEEEELIRKYILENTDIDEKEAEDLIKNLDIKTIAAFEEAMDQVAYEHDREKSKAELFLAYVQEENKKEKIVALSKAMKNPPENLTAEDLEELVKNIDTYPELDNLDIITTEKDSYLYDILLWTGQYASTAVILEEKDTLKAIGTRTRKDCKIYPRPLPITALFQPPYNYTLEEIEKALEKMENEEDYQDIKTVTASNGGVCIYSTDFMSEKYARSLCQYLEVESKEHQ